MPVVCQVQDVVVRQRRVVHREKYDRAARTARRPGEEGHPHGADSLRRRQVRRRIPAEQPARNSLTERFSMRKYATEFIGTFFLVFTICNAVLAKAPLAPLAIAAVLAAMIFAGG